MAFFPVQPTDFFETAGQFLGGVAESGASFNTQSVGGPSGYSTRQSRIPNERVAVSGRKLIHWLVPEGPLVQMYINPQNIRINNKKIITPTRTKGGFVIQYWGEDLGTLSLSGTTGTSGIEGINVLHDIYRNEQIAFDPYALSAAAKQEQDTFSGDIFGLDSALSSGENFVSSLIGASQASGAGVRPSPSLASLAFTVEMYWSGEVFRGYFTEFSVTESADQIGIFNYDIGFTFTQKRGYRQNFFGWHRSATSGPSNSDPLVGTPHSYGSLSSEFVSGQSTPTVQTSTPASIADSIFDSL